MIYTIKRFYIIGIKKICNYTSFNNVWGEHTSSAQPSRHPAIRQSCAQ